MYNGLVFTCIHFFGWNEHRRPSNLQLEQLVKRFKLKIGLRAKVGRGGVQVSDIVSTIM